MTGSERDVDLRGGFVRGFRTCLPNSLRLFFRRELLLDLGGDGVGVHLVGRGCFAQHLRGISPRCRQQNHGFNQSTSHGVLVRAAKVGGKSLRNAAIIPLLPDAMLPRQHLQAVFFQEACQPLDDKQEVPFHQPHRDRRANCRENSKPGDVGDGFLSAPLLLFGLELGVACASPGLLLRMVDRAGGIGADFVDRTRSKDRTVGRK
jgi:hypothetical protein